MYSHRPAPGLPGSSPSLPSLPLPLHAHTKGKGLLHLHSWTPGASPPSSPPPMLEPRPLASRPDTLRLRCQTRRLWRMEG